MNGDKEDHDLLIRIDTKVGMIHDSYIKHCEEASARFSGVSKTIETAHKRIDSIGGKLIWIALFGVLGIIILAIVILTNVNVAGI